MLLSVGFEGAVARMGKAWERQKFKSKDEMLRNIFQETGIISGRMTCAGGLVGNKDMNIKQLNIEGNHQILLTGHGLMIEFCTI